MSSGSWSQRKETEHSRRQRRSPFPKVAHCDPLGQGKALQSFAQSPLDPREAHNPPAHRSSLRDPRSSMHGAPISTGKSPKHPRVQTFCSGKTGRVRHRKGIPQSASLTQERRQNRPCQASRVSTLGVEGTRFAHTSSSPQSCCWQLRVHMPDDGPRVQDALAEQRQDSPSAHWLAAWQAPPVGFAVTITASSAVWLTVTPPAPIPMTLRVNLPGIA